MEERPKHVWREPKDGEPMEVGGVCVICGRYADTDEPCERGEEMTPTSMHEHQ